MRLIERNPELVRNAWLELSPERLLITPLLLIAVCALHWLAQAPQLAAVTTRFGFPFALLAVIGWGARRSGESLREEQLAGTWDAQRMSGLSAWQLASGKLFGGASFSWYLAAWCIALTLPARLAQLGLPIVALQVCVIIGLGLVAQACGLLAALGGNLGPSRKRSFGVLITGLLVLSLAWFPLGITAHDLGGSWWSAPLHWWGAELPRTGFVLASLLVAVALALLGIERRMREELQQPGLPWPWLLALAALYVYTGGFVWSQQLPALTLRWHGLQPPAWMLAMVDRPFVVASSWAMLTMTLCYLSFFYEARDPILWRRGLHAAVRGDWRRALSQTPLWLLSLLVAAVLTVTAALLSASVPLALRGTAMLVFVVRDLALMLAVSLSGTRSRAAAAPFSLLLVVYVLIPVLLWLAGLHALVPLLNPQLISGSASMLLCSALLQAVAAAVWLRLRWRAVFTLR